MRLQINESGDKEMDEECDMITVHDEPGRRQLYDALIIYTDVDIAVSLDIVTKLERDHNVTLCVPDRDLLPSTSFYTAMSHLISARCTKVILVLSSNSAQCQLCDFAIKIATNENRAIIPLLIAPCTIPILLRTKILCNHQESKESSYFWFNLARSITASRNILCLNRYQETTNNDRWNYCSAKTDDVPSKPNSLTKPGVSDTTTTTSSKFMNNFDVNQNELENMQNLTTADLDAYFKCLESKCGFIIRKFMSKMSQKIQKLKSLICEE